VRTKAAVLWEVGTPWSVEEVELADPGAGQVLVRLAATGLCHSDDHAVTGDAPAGLPTVGGHEGAGVVEALGPGVDRAAVGDHALLAFNFPCGHCRYCADGRSALCYVARRRLEGKAYRSPFSRDGRPIAAMGGLGTFSQYTVVPQESLVPIDKDVSFDIAALLGCAVTTGWGAAVHLAGVRPGEHVVVIGCGGVGMNSLQGARTAGADIVVAVDPNAYKREQAATFGATHAVADIPEAKALLEELTHGHLADVAILSVGVGSSALIRPDDDHRRPRRSRRHHCGHAGCSRCHRDVCHRLHRVPPRMPWPSGGGGIGLLRSRTGNRGFASRAKDRPPASR
jgi:S-(hydroxymethyl)glutathione dehydrogenase/alcohol dehydrogenase